MDELRSENAWEMTCPGCTNACRLTVHGRTVAELKAVQGSSCGAGFTYARRALAAKAATFEEQAHMNLVGENAKC